MQNLKKRKPTHIEDQIDNVVMESNHDNDVIDIDISGSFYISLRKDTFVKSTFEETSTPDVNENIFDMDANISSSKQTITSLPVMGVQHQPLLL